MDVAFDGASRLVWTERGLDTLFKPALKLKRDSSRLAAAYEAEAGRLLRATREMNDLLAGIRDEAAARAAAGRVKAAAGHMAPSRPVWDFDSEETRPALDAGRAAEAGPATVALHAHVLRIRLDPKLDAALSDALADVPGFTLPAGAPLPVVPADLFAAASKDPAGVETRYRGKALLVTGKVREVKTEPDFSGRPVTTITLDPERRKGDPAQPFPARCECIPAATAPAAKIAPGTSLRVVGTIHSDEVKYTPEALLMHDCVPLVGG